MNPIRLCAALHFSLAIAPILCGLPVAETEQPKSPAMSPQLTAFLAAEDLDDVGDARKPIKALDATDTAAIRSVLKQWKPSQAVANLLMNPSLIPQDVRLATLRRALAERRTPYLVLAAVVGFQEVDPDKLSAKDRKQVTADLLAIMRANSDVRATRATLSFAGFARTSDAPGVIDPECGPALARACLPALLGAIEGKEERPVRAAALSVARLAPHATKAVPALAKALKTSSDQTEQAVLEALTAIGGEANKPLAERIKDSKAPLKTRQNALLQLAERDSPEDKQVAILIESLKDREVGIRAVAVESISQLGPRAKSATPALLALLGESDVDRAARSPWRKDILAHALARMGKTTVPGLAAVVKDEAKTIRARTQAIRALGKMGRKAEAAQTALAVAMKDHNLAVAVEAAGAVARVGGDVSKALPILKRGLADDSPQLVRLAASEVEALGVRASALAPNLLPVLKHRDRKVRMSAVQAVATLGPAAKPAVPVLARLLKSGDGRERHGDVVAEALERLGPDAADALPALVERLGNLEQISPNPVISAIGSLGAKAKPAVPALVKLMEQENKDWEFFSEDAINALGRIGPEARSAVPRLMAQLTKSDDQFFCADAARALGRIGPDARAAVPELEKRLADVSLRVRLWGAFALIRITGESKGRLPVLLDLWNSDEDLALAEAFAELGAKARPARDMLLRALEDEDTPDGIHRRVALALGRLPDEAAVVVPRLIALTKVLAERSMRRRNQEHALAALELLGPKAKAAIPRMRALAEDDDEAVAAAAERALAKVEGK
jgi:hypothetical protein